MKTIKYLFVLGFVAISACQTSNEPSYAMQNLESPAGQGTEEPNLFTDSKGDVYMSWIEKKQKHAKLFFSKLEGDSWSEPNMISEGSNWFVNWADFPTFIVNNEVMAAHWLQKSAGGTYDYDVRMVLSNNSGESWNDSFIPHTDGVSAEHGFVSMLPMEDNQVFATWLDGRYTKTETLSESGHGGGGAMTLRAAIFAANGDTVNEWELDNRVCDCCQTSATMTANGPVVAYRNRSEEEIRDMSIVRLIDGEWTDPEVIHADDWTIAGCPVNGPSIVADGESTAVAWFTASGGNPMVKLAISNDAGESFSAPVTVSEGSTNGRVGTAMLPDQSIVVTWMETVEEAAHIMMAHYSTSGDLLKKMEVAESIPSRRSGFPVITSSGNGVFMAWTEVGEVTKVRTAKINL